MLQSAEPETATARRPADLVDRLNRIRLERDLTYAELTAAINRASPARRPIEQTLIFRFLNRSQKPIERTLDKIRRYVEQIEAREK